MRKFLVLLTLAFGFAVFLLTEEEFDGLELVDTGDLVLVEQVEPEEEELEGSEQASEKAQTITGRVVRVDGTGVSGMRVRLEHPWVPEVATVSDIDGNFTLTPSELRGELVPESVSWVLVGGTRGLTRSRTKDYVVVVAPPVSVRGAVTDTEGAPVEGARVFAHPPTNAMVPLGISAIPVESPEQVAYTGADGTFQVGPLAGVPGAEVEVTRHGYRPAIVPLPEDPAVELMVVLEVEPD